MQRRRALRDLLKGSEYESYACGQGYSGFNMIEEGTEQIFEDANIKVKQLVSHFEVCTVY